MINCGWRFAVVVVLSLISLALVLLFPYHLEATSLLSMSVEELSQKADLIVQGTVVDLKGELTADKTAIHTTVLISVQDQWKGKSTSSVTLVQPGGSLGEIVEEVPGLPSFKPSEKVILFLKEMPEGKLIVFGGEQGKFVLRFDADSGSEMVEGSTGEKAAFSDFACRVKKALGHSPSCPTPDGIKIQGKNQERFGQN